jgi:penicillin amidase
MASWWQKTLLTAAGLAGIAGGSYYLLTRRPLPRKKGKLVLHGLHEKVEIITDQYGIPHIYAENEDDLFFSQGYIHAQDRLWQMDLNRRIGSGRLSEVVGPATLELDRFCRRLGLHRAAEEAAARLSTHDRRLLETYARGVNAYIEQYRNRLPIEFAILRYRPEPWKASDTLQWGKMMGWTLSGNWETEIIRARLVARLGPDQAARLESGYDPHQPLIVPPGVEYNGVNLGLLEQYEQIKELSGFGMLGGSNNWVVDGTMTTTGAPMLCNDPHLGQAAPSIWYECHLVAGDIDVIGASFPGSPGIIIGHNQYIAWGMTNAVSDVEDLYIEKFHPEKPHLYEFEGRWEEAHIIREEIKIRGKKEPVVEEVRITRHGPVITSLPIPGGNGAASELPLALRWTGMEQNHIISALQKLDRATNWHEFREALRDWDVPPQNFVYADIEGNIGYIMAGAIPIRKKGQALLPSPGWTGEYEWSGLIPFEELPQTYNPEQHFVATANNRVVDDSYPYYISNEWLSGYRAQRIRDLLTSRGKLSRSDMAAIQADYYSIPASQIVPHLLTLQATTRLEWAALDMLRAWDYTLAPDSVGAAIYTTFYRHLERVVLSAIVGDDEQLLQSYLGSGSNLLVLINGYMGRSKPLVIRLLNEHDDSWFANSAVPNGPASWDSALARAFSAAIEELRDQLGDDLTRWQYRKIHKMTFVHALGLVKPLNLYFNRGPYGIGGDADTVNVSIALPRTPREVITVPSYRQIIDLGNLHRSLSSHSPGQSGHRASKHYDDFIDLFLTNKRHPMFYDRDTIEAHSEGILHLWPKKYS